ncbi:MAG: WHG domain-containing protein, partial [Mesorhizobium sp.]
QAYIAFAMQNPALYRLMFSAEEGRSTGLHLSDSALSVFEVTVELLRRGQAAGLIRNRPIQGQAATCWALLHGIAMLAIDGLLVPEKVGPNPLEAALDTLIEGLAVEQG